MKQYILHCLKIAFILCCTVILGIGCDDAGYKSQQHKVYFAEAANSFYKSVVMEEAGAKADITLRIDKPVGHDISIKLALDPSLIDKYNAINQTEVKQLPVEHIKNFDFNTPIIIPANEVTASSTVINIEHFASNDRYGIPLKISEVNGAGVTKTSSSYLLLIDKPLIVSTPTFTGAYGDYVKCGPFVPDSNPLKAANNWGIVTSEWSLEFWVKIDGFYQNQALFNSGSDEDAPNNEIYIRFGDADSQRQFQWLQIKTMGTQADTAKDFVANKWYHIAIVYDGTQVIIYVNGEPKAAKATKGGSIKIDQMQMISSETWFRAKCNMSEIRFWKKAVSQTHIRNNRFFEVDPTNPDLIAYWKMNEGAGNEFKDVTGNGHDAVASNSIFKGWVHDQRFDR